MPTMRFTPGWTVGWHSYRIDFTHAPATGRVEASIVHSLLNLTHLFLFTYPFAAWRVARVSDSAPGRPPPPPQPAQG